MPHARSQLVAYLKPRVRAFVRSRRTRRWAVGILCALAVYGLIGFFALPPLIRQSAVLQLSSLLARPVTIRSVHLNPYTLRLEIDGLQIGGRAADGALTAPLANVGELIVDASWTSLLRLKPIVQEIYVDALRLHVVRRAPQQFNFTDLVRKFSKPSGKPVGKPLLFSVSNIHLDNGRIVFDDRVTGQQHIIDHLQFGIPFIANLPSDTKVFVQPFLTARIDGSPLHVAGKVKPFDPSRASDVTIRLRRLDLPKLFSYAPATLPVVLTHGSLSADLELRFAVNSGKPRIDLSGSVDLDHLAITNRKSQPLLDADAIHLAATKVEPLQRIVHLSDVRIVKPSVQLSRDAGGVLNIARLAPAKPTHAGDKPHVTDPPAATTAKAPAARPLDLQLAQLKVEGGSVHFQDHKTTEPTTLSLSHITLDVRQLSTLGNAPAHVKLGLKLDQGGVLNSTGSLVLHKKTFDGSLSVDQLALPTFQPYLAGLLNGRLAAGDAAAKLAVDADWSGKKASIRIGDGDLTVDALRVDADHAHKTAVALKHLAIKIKRIDTAKRDADIPSIEIDALAVNARRRHDGRINLLQMVRPASNRGTRSARPQDAAKAPGWTYRIGDVAVADSSIAFIDRSNARPVSFDVSALKLHLRNLTQDLAKAVPISASARLPGKGGLQLSGTLAPTPLKARLMLHLVGLDVAALEPYFASKLNAKLSSAWFGARGTLYLHQHDKAMDVGYDGSAGLWRVKMLDKATGDRFAGWHGLRLAPIHARYRPGAVDVHIGTISLDDFYGRIFLDSSGKLNLSRFMAHNEQAGKESLTRTEMPAAPASAPTPVTTATVAASATSAAAASGGMKMKLHVDKTELSGGEVDYSDEFIKPHFSAELTDIQGSLGAIGTDTKQPAPLQVQARLNDNGTVKIDGSTNPLAKPAFLDATATARDVMLTHFSAYSTKYAGYPIERGKLNVDLHYKLDHQQLTADNHIFISQLTFGQHVDNSTATHLPVLLAVALLKNPQGAIDVDVPVSGSLSDPQFSIGGVIWSAFSNLIEKALTSPFSLLADAFGGQHHEHLNYVEFDPGSAQLTDQAVRKLAVLGKALKHRPQLKIVLIGRVDPGTDTEGLKQLELERRIKQAKLATMGSKARGMKLDQMQLKPDEYDEYLARVYSDADIKKPRNFFGFAKHIPPAKMKQLLLDGEKVTPADLAHLASRRAEVVRQTLATTVGADRVSVALPGSVAAQHAAQRAHKTGEPPPTRVDFTLQR